MTQPEVDDFVPRLLSAIDELEQTATGCGDADDRRWKWDLHAETVRSESGDYVACGPWDCDINGAYALHMVRNDPNVVLRRCAADRNVVERHGIFHSVGLGGDERWCTQCKHSRWPCPDLRDRAAAYGVEIGVAP